MMTLHLPNMTLLTPLAQTLSGQQRLRAVQEAPSLSSNSPVYVVLLVLLVLALGGGLLALVWHARKREEQKARGKAFEEAASRAGLAEEEQHLLATIAQLANLPEPEAIFTSEVAFNEAANRLANGEAQAAAVRAAPMCASCTFLASLREKLGFRPGPGASRPTNVKLGRIPKGARLEIVRQRQPQNFTALCSTTTDGEAELSVFPEKVVACGVGEDWTVRYPQDGILWEFRAQITRIAEGQVFLAPGGEVRCVNRRRFARSESGRGAWVALFPFVRPSHEGETPRFVPATLAEIAGPGIQLVCPLHASVDDRVLVVIELNARRSVESVGVVRRVGTGANGAPFLGIELIGLSTEQVADLARETNRQARHPAEEAVALSAGA